MWGKRVMKSSCSVAASAPAGATIPSTSRKPLVPLGGRPILWHVMKYYSHYGHNDFTLCLGYKGDLIEALFRRRR